MKHARHGWLMLLLLLLGACGGGTTAPAPPASAPPADAAGPSALQVQVTLDSAGQALAASSVGGLHFVVHVVSPKMATRRIEPGEVPYDLGLGTPVALPTGQWLVSGLPAGQNLLVQVAFTPAVDLSTGLALPTGSSYQAAVHFPVQVPASGTLELVIALRFSANPAGGYFIDGALQRADLPALPPLTRLDYAASTVTCDSDGDGDFSNDPQLADPQHLGVSPALLERLAAQNDAGAAGAGSTLYTAHVDSVDAANGAVHVSGLAPLETAPAGPAPETVRFAEDTVCTERLVKPAAELDQSVAPQHFAAGDPVTLVGTCLPGADGQTPPQLWVSDMHRLTLDLPPDSIVAVPDKQAARPGEPVPVTVYVNQTAQPLDAVRNLRISFDARNSYLAGSLDPGDRGGGAALADGVWAGAAVGGFKLPDVTKVASGVLSDGRAYVDLSLAPVQSASVAHASGALCSFELVCHEDAALGIERADSTGLATAYAPPGGGAVQWANCITATAPQVAVSGQPLELALVAPALDSAGSGPAPVAAGSTLQFKLTDPPAGDVSALPATRYYVQRCGAELQTISSPQFQIPAGYAGPVTVDAAYNGVYCRPETRLSLFVDAPQGFSTTLHAPQTCVFGGSAQGVELHATSAPSALQLAVEVTGAHDLHALYFRLAYDPALYAFDTLAVHDPLRSQVLLPPVGTFQTGEPGVLEIGLAALHPQSSSVDFNGGQLELQFTRLSAGPATSPGTGPTGLHAPMEPCALLSVNPARRTCTWQPYLAGDFNQDGVVALTPSSSNGLTDWTCLATQLNAAGFAPDSPADVIDRTWDAQQQAFYGDGLVDLWSIASFSQHTDDAVTAWRLYYRPPVAAGDTPGTLLTEVPYTAFSGDPQQGRIAYHWPSPAPLAAGSYWLVPVCAGVEGAACPTVLVPGS